MVRVFEEGTMLFSKVAQNVLGRSDKSTEKLKYFLYNFLYFYVLPLFLFLFLVCI
jgi:hypothetical protein